jgi:hypothetical protein
VAEHPRKRSNPAALLKEKQAIVEDMESRLQPDTEDPESAARRKKKFGMPPSIKGGLVTGVSKRKSTI